MYKLLLPALFLILFIGCRPTERPYEERRPSHESPVIIKERVVEEKPIIVEERPNPIIVQPVPHYTPPRRIIIDRRRPTPVPHQPAPRRPFDRRGERGR